MTDQRPLAFWEGIRLVVGTLQFFVCFVAPFVLFTPPRDADGTLANIGFAATLIAFIGLGMGGLINACLSLSDVNVPAPPPAEGK